MLTDAALRNLKHKSKIYKASDRDGMYETVSPGGTVTLGMPELGSVSLHMLEAFIAGDRGFRRGRGDDTRPAPRAAIPKG